MKSDVTKVNTETAFTSSLLPFRHVACLPLIAFSSVQGPFLPHACFPFAKALLKPFSKDTPRGLFGVR